MGASAITPVTAGYPSIPGNLVKSKTTAEQGASHPKNGGAGAALFEQPVLALIRSLPSPPAMSAGEVDADPRLGTILDVSA